MWNNILSAIKWCYARAKMGILWLCTLFNILEPDVDAPIFSISKIAAWGTTFSTLWITIHNPQSEALAGSVAAQTAAMANYAYRRWVQYKSGTGAYAGALGQVAAPAADDPPPPAYTPPTGGIM